MAESTQTAQATNGVRPAVTATPTGGAALVIPNAVIIMYRATDAKRDKKGDIREASWTIEVGRAGTDERFQFYTKDEHLGAEFARLPQFQPGQLIVGIEGGHFRGEFFYRAVSVLWK